MIDKLIESKMLTIEEGLVIRESIGEVYNKDDKEIGNISKSWNNSIIYIEMEDLPMVSLDIGKIIQLVIKDIKENISKIEGGE